MEVSGFQDPIPMAVDRLTLGDLCRTGTDWLPDNSRVCSSCRERCSKTTKDCCLHGNCCILDHLKRASQLLGGLWSPNFNFLVDCILHLKAAENAAAVAREIAGHGFFSNVPSSGKYQDGADSNRENQKLYKGTAKSNSISGQYNIIPEEGGVCSLPKDCVWPSDHIPEHCKKQHLDPYSADTEKVLTDVVGKDHVASSINISQEGRENLSEVTFKTELSVQHAIGQSQAESPLGDKDYIHVLHPDSADIPKDLSDLGHQSSIDISLREKSDLNEITAEARLPVNHSIDQSLAGLSLGYKGYLSFLETHHRSSGDEDYRHVLDIDSPDKPKDASDLAGPSSISISQWGKSDVNEVPSKTQLPVNHTIDQNLAELSSGDKDYLSFLDSITKHDTPYNLRCNTTHHGKLLRKKRANDDPTFLTTCKKQHRASDASDQKESSNLLLDEDYRIFLEHIRVHGDSYVLASEKFSDCSSVTTTKEDASLKDKDYELFLKHVRPHGHSFILELMDTEQRIVSIKYEEDCSLTKNTKQQNRTVKATDIKKTVFDGSTKRSLSGNNEAVDIKRSVSDTSSKRSMLRNKNGPVCPMNMRKSPRLVQLIEKRPDNSGTSRVQSFPEKSRQCNSSRPVETTTSTAFGNIMSNFCCVKSDSFMMNLQDLLTKAYNKQEHEELMKEATCRKPVYKERQLRGSSKTYLTEVMGLSYLDYYPDFQKRLESTNGGEQLKLLRGFFFWLHNSCREDSFKPWRCKNQGVQPVEYVAVER